jgi:signal transduction histidine kinase
LFLLWCLHSYFPAQAQTGDLSALLQAKDDTAKVNHLQAYAQTLLDKDNAKAYALFETSTHISQQLGYDRGIANGYRKMGYVHGQEGRYRDAIQYLLTALEYNDKSQAPIKEYLACYNNLGVNYGQLGMGDSTMHYYLFAINKIENRSTTKEEPAARRSILISYCLLLQNVSIVNAGHGNIGKAKEYGQKAIAAAREVNDSAQLTLALVSTANAFYTNKEYDKSLPFIRQAIAAGSSLSNPIPKAKAWRLLSMNYTARAMPDSGIYAAQKALDYSRTTDKQVYLAALMDLSDAYRQKKDHTAEARTLKMAANEFDGLADNLILGNSLYEKLAHAQYNNEAYQEAYDHLWQSGKYKDSLRSRQNQETINKLEIQYQAAQKEKALATQQLALHKSRQQVLIIIALLIVALMAAALLYLRARNKRKLHRQQLTELYQEKEIQLLQALMQGEEKERNRIAKDLHDGVAGMLAAVKMHFFAAAPAHETVQHGTNYKQGMYLLDEAAGELRKISHNLLPEQLLDHGLDEAIRRYCTNISLTGKLEIQYDSWGHIGRYRESFELSVYRIVQELLNNIVKHSKATQAIVQMSLSNNILSITIEDNGIGFNKEQLPGEGMGLHSLASRMQAINGKIELDTSIGNGVNAYLELDTLGLQR